MRNYQNVAKEIADGLEDGSIVLRRENPQPEFDYSHIEERNAPWYERALDYLFGWMLDRDNPISGESETSISDYRNKDSKLEKD